MHFLPESPYHGGLHSRFRAHYHGQMTRRFQEKKKNKPQNFTYSPLIRPAASGRHIAPQRLSRYGCCCYHIWSCSSCLYCLRCHLLLLLQNCLYRNKKLCARRAFGRGRLAYLGVVAVWDIHVITNCKGEVIYDVPNFFLGDDNRSW